MDAGVGKEDWWRGK